MLRRDLKDTFDSAVSAVAAVTVVALLANDTGNAVESKAVITGKDYLEHLKKIYIVIILHQDLR